MLRIFAVRTRAFSRHKFCPVTACLSVLMLVLGGCDSGRQRSTPNFVVVFVDDLGYGDIGPFGSRINSTPHLDRMAAEGMKLTSFYSASPVCTPSRAALMTGSYPKRVGLATGPEMGVLFTGEPWGLNPDEVTIAEILREQGYATGCFGKWHLGDQPAFLPTEHGFDEYFGIPYSNDMWPLHPGFTNEGPFHFPPLPLMRGADVIGEVRDMRDQAELCRKFTEETVSFIRRNRDRPFFAFLPHAFVHHPRAASEPFMESAGEPASSVDWTAITRGSVPWHCGTDGECGPGTMDKEAWDLLVRRRTQAQIEEVDWSVGEILDVLQELGLAEDTLVIFTSDNGGATGCVNAPLRAGKGTTWEGGMREPTLAWWPGSVPAGSACDEVATMMDLLPTFTNLSGGNLPSDRILDGRDISPLLLANEGAKSPHQAFYYYRQHDLEAVRAGQWKLFRASGELYNLQQDIGETQDVSQSHPDVVERLTGYFDEMARDLGDSAESCPRCRAVGKVEDPTTLLPYRDEN